MAEKWKGCGGFSKEPAMLSRIFLESNSFCQFFKNPAAGSTKPDPFRPYKIISESRIRVVSAGRAGNTKYNLKVTESLVSILMSSP